MTPTLQRILLAVVGLLLLTVPVFLNTLVFENNYRAYAPGHVGALNRSATPVPTPTPITTIDSTQRLVDELRAGPVVVDLAHGNRLSRAAFEPLAAALAERGVGMQFWLSNVDLLSLTSYYDYPDQSAQLRPLLDDAGALIVISPFFLWSPQEIALVERFVARGGRLLLISDPDILGDLAQDINNLAEPFGVVFHDDYLYNTVENDGNFVHVYQDRFVDRASHLTGADIVLYGARSLGGDIQPQVRTGNNVLSSLRTGVVQFDTVALAGVEARGTAGRVLAMTDFDVLTQPYVVRHDNRYLLEFVADFLATGEMRENVVDFPAFLGRDVTLVFGTLPDDNGIDAAVDAATLLQGARLQQTLEAGGRTLSLAGTGALTRTLEPMLDAESAALASDLSENRDWLVLADYRVADQTSLLADLGFTLVEVAPTPSPEDEDPADEDESAESSPQETDNGDTDSTDTDSTDTENGDTENNDTGNGDTENGDGENGLQTEEETRILGIEVQIDVTPQTPEEPEPQATPSPDDPAQEDPEQEDPVNDDPPGDEPSDDEPGNDEPGDAPTPDATPTPTPTVTITVTSTVEPDATPAIEPGTATATPTETPTATPGPEPESTFYLVRDDGLRLLASQTVLIAQRELPLGGHLVAVLGLDSAGLSAGVDRLLARNYEGCITGDALVVCSYADGRAPSAATPTPGIPQPEAGTPTPTPEGPPPTDPDPMATPVPTPGAPDAPVARILVVDDDANVAEGEYSEADIYLQNLSAQGLQPDLWSVNSQGVPSSRQLLEYRWVIWSAGGYEGGGPTLNALDSLLGYINDGGRLTISSRRPFFGMGTGDASVIVDVRVEGDIPSMIMGLPSEPFALQEGLPPVVPLEINARENGPRVVLRRGPQSGDADAPLLFMVDDTTEEDSTGARLMIMGMSLTWFTEGHERTLVSNMVPVMLGD